MDEPNTKLYNVLTRLEYEKKVSRSYWDYIWLVLVAYALVLAYKVSKLLAFFSCSRSYFKAITYSSLIYLKNVSFFPHTHPLLACLATRSTEVAMDKCHGKRKCNIKADSQLFGKPCSPGSLNYLKVRSFCVFCIYKQKKIKNNNFCSLFILKIYLLRLFTLVVSIHFLYQHLLLF